MPQFTTYLRFFTIGIFLLFYFSVKADTIYQFSHADSMRGSLNAARSCYDVTSYFLQIRIDTTNRTISGINKIDFVAVRNFDSLQLDLFSQFDITDVRNGNDRLDNMREGNHFMVYFPEQFKAGDSGSISVHYKGKPQEAKHPPWDGGFIWRNDSLGKLWLTTACQGLGASSWWPCKDHLSDEPDRVTISVQVPQGLKVISNGKFEGIKNVERGEKVHTWRVDYPINTYNVALNIGDYVHIHDIYKYQGQEKGLSLDYYVLPYHEQQARVYFEEEVKPMLDCFERYFGKYPFKSDGYALVETPYWGMEHQSAVAYGNDFKRNEFGFDFIIVHETGHEWWGNAVSCKDNAELWLHESFTTYSEALYVECRWGYQKALEYLLKQKAYIENNEPLVGPMGVNFNDRQDNDIYHKGAWVLHTLRNVINNDTLWFRIIYDFQQKNSMKTISSQDFIDHVNAYTGGSYSVFFEQYLYQARPPRFVYTVTKKGRHTILDHRLDTEVDGMNMPVEIWIGDNRSQRIISISETQQIKLSNTSPEQVKLRTDLFYVIPVLE